MKRRLIKSPWFYILLFIILSALYLFNKVNSRINPAPRITDSPTSIIGFNHVGIFVKDLDRMVSFYQKATNYRLLKKVLVNGSAEADKLFGITGIEFEKAILKGPNMLLELTEFANQADSHLAKRLPQGPGMTHTCYQSANVDSGYDKFIAAGTDMLSRGEEPIDLGGYSVTYAYGYDPEGNMIELEQMSDLITKLQIGTGYAKKNPLWMTQVALLSPDLPQLIEFYKLVLDIEPYRVGNYKDNSGFDDIVDIDNVAFDAAWFGMDSQGKKLELMQYVNPPTPAPLLNRQITDLGYSFSFEVLDIQLEYERLKHHGVTFISEPQILEDFWTVFAFDVDENLFSLRQAIDTESIYSLKNF